MENYRNLWDITFLRLSLITEGATEKVSQFRMKQKSVHK